MRLSLLISCIIFTFLLGITGCVPWYCCGYQAYYYNCIKEADTAWNYVSGPQGSLNNALNPYTSQGYVCTTMDLGVATDNCVRGLIEKDRAVRSGQQCIGSTGSNCSPTGQQCGP